RNVTGVQTCALTILGEEKKIIPVLKANAYGHGSVEVAKYLENEHYDFFAVALLEEAMELRKAGVKATILVLGWVAPRYAYLAARSEERRVGKECTYR